MLPENSLEMYGKVKLVTIKSEEIYGGIPVLIWLKNVDICTD